MPPKMTTSTGGEQSFEPSKEQQHEQQGDQHGRIGEPLELLALDPSGLPEPDDHGGR
jgi:hypothetical protein